MKMLRAIRELGGTVLASPQPSVTEDTAEPFRDLVNAAKLPWRIERDQPLDLSFAALRQSGLNLLPHNEISKTHGPSATAGTTGRVCPRLQAFDDAAAQTVIGPQWDTFRGSKPPLLDGAPVTSHLGVILDETLRQSPNRRDS
jgi:hypothetical protein